MSVNYSYSSNNYNGVSKVSKNSLFDQIYAASKGVSFNPQFI